MRKVHTEKQPSCNWTEITSNWTFVMVVFIAFASKHIMCFYFIQSSIYILNKTAVYPHWIGIWRSIHKHTVAYTVLKVHRGTLFGALLHCHSSFISWLPIRHIRGDQWVTVWYSGQLKARTEPELSQRLQAFGCVFATISHATDQWGYYWLF